MAILDMVRNALLAGFGAQQKMKEFIDELVKRGELSESQGAKLVKEWSEKVEKNTEDISKSINEVASKTLEKMNFATQEDLRKINEKIDLLAEKIAKLQNTQGV